MQKAYKDLDIQFLPDSVIQELNQQKLKTDLPQIHDSLLATSNYLSHILLTEILANEHLQNFGIHNLDNLNIFQS
jgi:hypothetical protein